MALAKLAMDHVARKGEARTEIKVAKLAVLTAAVAATPKLIEVLTKRKTRRSGER